MNDSVFVKKGDRVRVSRLKVQKLGTYSIAGMQAKVAAQGEDYWGEVVKVVGDHPTMPTQVMLIVRKDDGTQEVISPNHIIEHSPRT